MINKVILEWKYSYGGKIVDGKFTARYKLPDFLIVSIVIIINYYFKNWLGKLVSKIFIDKYFLLKFNH